MSCTWVENGFITDGVLGTSMWSLGLLEWLQVGHWSVRGLLSHRNVKSSKLGILQCDSVKNV